MPTRARSRDSCSFARDALRASLLSPATRGRLLAASRSLQGEFSKQVNFVRERLIGLRQQVEAGIDFPEDECDLLAEIKLEEELLLLFNILSNNS